MYKVGEFYDYVNFARSIGATRIEEVPIQPTEDAELFKCHNNASFNPILGYYFVTDIHGIQHAFKHSVLSTGKRLIDVTPVLDDRNYNIFAYGSNFTEEHLTYAEGSVFINKNKRETELMYYVYALIDPRTNQPFYIGKGKDDRALSHFTERVLLLESNTKKTAKIKKLQSLGFKPMIEFYAQNIEDEKLAYMIEEFYIKKLGRIGFEENGVLTNVCLGSNPPNFSGMTYDQIYKTKERKTEVIEKKRKLQLEAGGYGPKIHTEETKRKISLKTSGKNNPRFGAVISGTPTAKKIGDANRGKKHYNRNDIKLYYIDGLDITIYSNDLRQFCIENNYSHATFLTQVNKNWPRSKKGKNKGLLMTIKETEITSYIQGGTKQDVSNDTFKGFSL